jgi:hypothetical protein
MSDVRCRMLQDWYSVRHSSSRKGPHTRTSLPSVLTAKLITAQLDRECVENSVSCAVKISDCVTFATAKDLTAQFTLDCIVCCVLKAEASLAQFGLRSSAEYVPVTRKCHSYFQGGLKNLQPGKCVTLSYYTVQKCLCENGHLCCEVETVNSMSGDFWRSCRTF